MTPDHPMNSILHFTWSLLVVLSAGAAVAPVPGQQSITEQHNARFAEQKPLVGEVLPDASGFDIEGAPFALEDTRGKVTVIVSGCLT